MRRETNICHIRKSVRTTFLGKLGGRCSKGGMLLHGGPSSNHKIFASAEESAAQRKFFGANFKKAVTRAVTNMALAADGGNSFSFVARSLFVENAHGQITIQDAYDKYRDFVTIKNYPLLNLNHFGSMMHSTFNLKMRKINVNDPCHNKVLRKSE